ncbi:MAG: hypothetical protein ACRDI3_02145 [Actinomycetota bacterium]
MGELLQRRRGPFLAVLAAGIVVCAAVVSIPDSLLSQIERNRPLTDAQVGWAYRLIAIAATVQLVYGGFSVFRVERVQSARERDPRVAEMPHTRVISSLSRNAAGMVALTLFYGLATMAVSGLRGGFWLFPLLAVAQGGWYYREIGEIARWKSFQPEPEEEERDVKPWQPNPAGHVPALARGLKTRD